MTILRLTLIMLILTSTLRPIHGWSRQRVLRMCSTSKSNRVCVVGGGFGGLYTALKLSQKQPSLDISLIDPKDKFVFLPLLYELAVGTASIVEVAPRYQELLQGTNINFVQGVVKNISNKKLIVDHDFGDVFESKEFEFDQLVIATGAQPRINMLAGAAEHAMTFSKVEDAVNVTIPCPHQISLVL